MKIKQVLSITGFMMAFSCYGQTPDSIRTFVMTEVVVGSEKLHSDTLQSFYQSNVSATTETVLSRMSGVSLVRRGAYGQEPVLRGLSGGQINVTIDGMKIFGACTDKMDPVTIYVEPMNLSVIQALPGSQGGLFGSTIGGSLDMKLAEPVVGSPGIRGQAGIDYQTSAGAVNAFSSANIARNTSAYRVNATFRKSNNYHAGGGEEVAYSQFQKLNVGASGKWALGKFDTLQADAIFDQGWNIGFPALPMDVGTARAGIYSVSYKNSTPWWFFRDIRAKVYQNSISHSMDDTHRENVPMHMDMPGKSTTTGGFLESNVGVFREQQTTVKAEYYSNTLIGEMTMFPAEGPPMYMQTAPQTTRQNAGLYVQQQIKFSPKNKMQLSARADAFFDRIHDGIGSQQWEVFDNELAKSTAKVLKTVNASFTHFISGSLQLDVQGGYGERIPTLNERYGFYLFNRLDGYDYIGKPGLKNEASWNMETTLSYFGGNTEFRLTPFYKTIDNYIMGRVVPDLTTMTIGARGVKQNENLAWAKMTGVDMLVMFSPFKNVQLVSNNKYTYGTNSLDEAMPQIPPFKSVSSVRVQLAKFNVQAEYEWAAAQNHISSSFGEMKTASYHIVSFRSGWKINSLFQVNGGVENILDRNYREHLDWGGIPRPGRNFYVNITYKF
jgi:iron complex outermembrane recepter protein